MKHIIVDFEMNNIRQGIGNRSVCTMEIVEIGAVMLGDDYQEISSFRTYVKPEFNDVVVPKITRLTGITYAMVADAPKFNDALRIFANWCLETGDQVSIYAWSNSDYYQVIMEMEMKEYELTEAEQQIFKEEWSDLQKKFDVLLGFDRQVSLKFALEMAGIDFTGREHSALDDARNAAELLQMFNDDEVFKVTLEKIEGIMRPTSLITTIGNIIDFATFSVE